MMMMSSFLPQCQPKSLLEGRAEILKTFSWQLGEMMTSEIHSEFNWSLRKLKSYIQTSLLFSFQWYDYLLLGTKKSNIFQVMEFAKTIEETRGNRYIRLTFISLIANAYESVIAFTVFFSTLKFSKLISFHKVIHLGVLATKPFEDLFTYIIFSVLSNAQFIKKQ